VDVVRVSIFSRLWEKLKAQLPKGTEIRVNFTAPEAENDLWKSCGGEGVKSITHLTDMTSVL